MNQAIPIDKQALRDMTTFAERVKLPIRLLFSEELFRLCWEDSQTPVQGIPPLLFDILLAVACQFTNNLCLKECRETLHFQLFPRGSQAPPGVAVEASFHSDPAGHTVTVRLLNGGLRQGPRRQTR